MKAFRFRLQSALDLRRRREDQLRAELAVLQERDRDETARLDRLQEDRDHAQSGIARERIGRMQPSDARDRERFLQSLDEAIEKQRDVLALLRAEIERKIAEVIAATRDTRALERLRERREAEHRRSMLREEQKFLDDLGSARSFHRSTLGDDAERRPASRRPPL